MGLPPPNRADYITVSQFTLDSDMAFSTFLFPTQSRGGAEIAFKSNAVVSPTAMQHSIIASLTKSSLFYTTSNLYVVN